MRISQSDLFQFLEEKYLQYNNSAFVDNDPISVPHQFSRKEDIEIAGFLTASIAWGNRKTILNNATKMMQWMDYSPFEFVVSSSENELEKFKGFIHRTFNGIDCLYFLKSLKNIYLVYGGLENLFKYNHGQENNVWNSIINFRKVFFELEYPPRTSKHIADPMKNSAAKRINMFLRWMVRSDSRGVDFGIWKNIRPSELLCPLDVHSGNVARKLGLLKRESNDLHAVIELTENLKKLDHNDPIKYDFALFGLGVFEKF